MILEMPDPNKAYYFGIKAIDAAGNISSLTTSDLPVKSYAADADGDGMPDLWETSHGLNPNVNDALNDDDGDGYLDGDEIAKGTDPANSDSYPRATTLAGDINSNGNVDLADAILALRALAGIDLPVTLADVDGDNKIGLEEVIYILQKVAGLR